jgi:hypothetical protein
LDATRAAYDALYCYTMERDRRSFILQHVVDAYAAQTATGSAASIGMTFALVGLYLHVEKGFSGRQVQQVHIQLARDKRLWPTFPVPQDRGAMTAVDVLRAPAGQEKTRSGDDSCPR